MAEPPTALTLRQLRELYLTHCRRHYRRRSGAQTREAQNIAGSLARFETYAGADSIAAKINRHQVRAWLDQLAAERLSRSFCNQCLARLRRMVRWAADLEYMTFATCEELRLVRPLAPFRSDAKEREERRPPPLDSTRLILPFLPPIPRDVVQLSMLCGARPSELLELTNAEVFIGGTAPRLQPQQHKTAHHGKTRVIPLTRAAVAIIERHARPMLPADYVFNSPRTPGGHYTLSAYAAAIARASKRAGLPKIRPYDIRHAVGRAVRSAAGLDAAQALLGHSNARTTEIYAPIDAADAATYTTAARGAEALR